MNISIDTKNKIIVLNEEVNIGEFMNFIINSLSDWKVYSIKSNTQSTCKGCSFNDPFIIRSEDILKGMDRVSTTAVFIN